MSKDKKKNSPSMKKYRKGKLWWLAVIFTVLAALSTPYNTGTYSLFFLLMEKKRLELLLPFVILYVLGQALLFFIDKIRLTITHKYEAQVMSELKIACIKDAIVKGKDSAEVISFIDNDLKLMHTQYFGNIFQMVTRISIVIFTLGLTMTSNWIFALVYLILGMLPLKLTSYFAKKIEKKTEQYSDSARDTTSVVRDVVRNKETLLNYNVMRSAIKRAKETIFNSETKMAERSNQVEYAEMYMNMLYTLANIIPIAVGIYMGIKGYLSISAFVAVQYSSGWIVGSLGSLAGLRSGIKSTRKICEKVLTFEDLCMAERVCEDVKNVEFKQVNFSYVPDKTILKDFSFKADNGKRILIQGASGSGKSTILKLISGELQPITGKVVLNGKELLHRKIGYVSQKPAIFADTICYNLTLGNVFSEEKISQAIEQAGLTEFVEEKGLDYVLEEDGNNISGGQKQRIEIARALLFDCSLLLIDEGTSALDEDTSIKIHNTIMNLKKTVIEVAHYIPENIKNKFDIVVEL